MFGFFRLLIPPLPLLGRPVNLNRNFTSVPMSGGLLWWRWLGRGGWRLDWRNGNDFLRHKLIHVH
jgi:hypothetical protein